MKAFLLLLFFFSQAPLAAQQAAVPPPAKCTIEGQVMKAATGEPLKKARLALRKAEAREQPVLAVTGTDGRFAFKEIEPGRYRLWVERNGYVRQEYGQRSPNRPGTILALEPGQQLRDVSFRLIPAAVITGRVYDEDGEATAGVSVQALRYSYLRGQRQLVPTGGASTNDLGEYRIFGLAPGSYYVSATYNPGLMMLGGAGGMAVVRTGEGGGEEGYAPTYYPGTNDPGRATPLVLREGDEVTRVDFTLLPTRAVRVRGRVFNTITGKPGRGAMVWLTPRESGIRSFFLRPIPVEDAQGNFELRGVTPGSYTVSASWFDEGKMYSTRMPLDVGATDIEGINLVIGPGVDLPGRVRVEGQTGAVRSSGSTQAAPGTAQEKSEGQLELTELRVFLEPREEVPMGGSSFASVKAEGTFLLQNVAAGSFRVRVMGAPPDFYLKSVRLAGEDVLEAGLEVSGGQSPGSLELALSANGGRIEGQVLTAEQQPFSGAQVVLVPEPRRRSQTHLYKTTPTDQYGRFTLQGIAPGDYKLFAWEEIEAGAYQDAEFLRPYEERGEPVSVREAGRLSVQLELIPAERTPR